MCVYVMLMCALLALAAVSSTLFHGAECLRKDRPFHRDPSAISNIELLIPLAFPLSRPDRPDRSSEEDHQTSKERDHDDAFSSIPAYAFTLDTGSTNTRTANYRSTPKIVQGRSLYVAQLWPYKGVSKEPDRPIDAPQKASQATCLALARQQKGSARELLLYLCLELIDVLSTKCSCGEEDTDAGRPFPRSDKASMPWFAALSGRRELSHVGDSIGPQKPRVFV